jgi:uncharacterized protein YehS (DUF1456 family)
MQQSAFFSHVDFEEAVLIISLIKTYNKFDCFILKRRGKERKVPVMKVIVRMTINPW